MSVCLKVRSWVMRYSKYFFATAAVILLLANCVSAEIITYQVAGNVDAGASKIDLPVYVPLPTTISGSLVYDTASGDTDTAGGHGLYYLDSLTLTLGGYTITAGANEGMLDATASPLSYLAYTNNGSAFIVEAGQTFTGIQVKLFDLVSSSAGTDAFPLTPPDVSQFDTKGFSVKYLNASLGVDIDVVGTVTAIVPEPATISLLAAASLFLRRRRR